ncbi:MAG TPA: hypothetical protein VLD36_18965 [Burkholderiales bacterium]|nr:hypothetical protein [Burkholderiales bacterium]
MNNLTTCVKASIVAVGAASCLVGGAPAHAQEKLSAEQLAKLAQNPIANLISVPFQNNINFNYGPRDGTQNILNIQPVIPFSLGKDWNLITRTILPIVTQPAFTANESTTTGLGDLQLSGFLSPASAEGVIWGAGAIMQAPTHGSDRLGNDRWGLGPTFVALRLEKGSPWVYGALVNNVWSAAGTTPSTTTSCSSRSSTTISPAASTSTRRRSSPRTGKPTRASAGRCRSAAASARSSTSGGCR